MGQIRRRQLTLGKTLYVSDRKTWRSWLSKHHGKEKEIWLVFPRKHTGKPRLPYNDAVEEALCFGWIDSTVKGVDKNSYAQRFSPRRSTTSWSQQNIERARRMVALRKMTPAGLAVIKDPKALLRNRRLEIALDILKALKQDKQVWTNFHKFPGDYKRIRIAFIESRRRRGPEEFQRSLNYFLRKTAKNKRFVFGDQADLKTSLRKSRLRPA